MLTSERRTRFEETAVCARVDIIASISFNQHLDGPKRDSLIHGYHVYSTIHLEKRKQLAKIVASYKTFQKSTETRLHTIHHKAEKLVQPVYRLLIKKTLFSNRSEILCFFSQGIDQLTLERSLDDPSFLFINK